MQVLKLDRNCEDAMTELLRVRTFQLTVGVQNIALENFAFLWCLFVCRQLWPI